MPRRAPREAVLTLMLAGCHEPQKALLTGTAVGVIDGRKQTIPLQIDPLSEPGTYALTRQWPDKGRWVLEFVAKDQGRITSTLVGAGPGRNRARERQDGHARTAA